MITPLRAVAGTHARRLGLLALADQGEQAAEPLVLEHRGLGEASGAAGTGIPFANAPELV